MQVKYIMRRRIEDEELLFNHEEARGQNDNVGDEEIESNGHKGD